MALAFAARGLGTGAVARFGGADDLVVKGYVDYRAFFFVWIGSYFPVLVSPMAVGVAGCASRVRATSYPVGFEDSWYACCDLFRG